MRRRRYGLAAAAAGAVAAALAVAVSSAGAGPARARASAADIAYAKAQIAKWSAIPKFTFKAPSFDAAKLKGRTVFNIPASSTIPFVVTIDQSMAKVARRFGLKFVEFANQGQPTQWGQGVQQAINQHAAAIDLMGAPNPAVLQPQLTAAKRAKISVVVTHYIDESAALPPNTTALVPVKFNQAARLEADWAIADTNGRADVLVIKSADVVPSNGLVAAMLDEFSKHCGSACKAKVVNVPLTDWATKIQSQVQSALTSDPNLNYVIPIYDSMSQFVVPAITAAGRIGKVHIATFNGTPFVMKMIEDGDIVRMDVAENLDWIGWANMDQIMRILSGLKPVKTEDMPLRMFTKQNIKETGTPPVVNKGLGNAYVAGYTKLWGG